jgi:hypothetical protein
MPAPMGAETGRPAGTDCYTIDNQHPHSPAGRAGPGKEA